MSDYHKIPRPKTAPSDPVLDIVFVHGLGGDWRWTWTWTNKDEQAYWPGMVASEYPAAQVWALDYPADPVKRGITIRRFFARDPHVAGKTGCSYPMPDLVPGMLEDAQYLGLGQRPIVWIGHSMGGLVIKYLLERARDTAPQVFEQTLLVLFYATPHGGAKPKSLAKYLAVILGLSASGRELSAYSPELRRLANWFDNAGAHIQHKTFVEMEDMPGVGRVVDQNSAGLHGNAMSIGRDHSGIVKPKDVLDEPHRRLVIKLDELLRKMPADSTSSSLDMPFIEAQLLQLDRSKHKAALTDYLLAQKVRVLDADSLCVLCPSVGRDAVDRFAALCFELVHIHLHDHSQFSAELAALVRDTKPLILRVPYGLDDKGCEAIRYQIEEHQANRTLQQWTSVCLTCPNGKGIDKLMESVERWRVQGLLKNLILVIAVKQPSADWPPINAMPALWIAEALQQIEKPDIETWIDSLEGAGEFKSQELAKLVQDALDYFLNKQSMPIGMAELRTRLREEANL